MAKISFTEKPSAACNQVLFEKLRDPRLRFEFLRRAIQPADVRRLKSLVYGSFLQTLHWSIVREYVISSKGGKCAACGSPGNLNVHHRSYRFQGEEFRDISCLVVLCQACHSGGHLQAAAKTEQEKIDAALTKISLSHGVEKQKSKANRNYDPRTIMNLKEHGDIRGYQGSNNGTTT